MTTDELLKQVLIDSKVQDIHPLHYAMMEECCERALNNSSSITDSRILQFAVDVAFLSASEMLKAALRAAFAKQDTVTLHFRGQAFTIDKDAALLS